MGFLDHEGRAEYPYHKGDVFDAVMKAISKVKGMKVSKSDKLSGHILVKTGVSLRSWGESVSISLEEISPGRTRVSIISAPKIGTLTSGGALDFGKNRQNIEKILEETSKVLKSKPPVESETLSQQATIDPAQRISKLKDLLDQGLISSEEFEKKKEDILSEI